MKQIDNITDSKIWKLNRTLSMKIKVKGFPLISSIKWNLYYSIIKTPHKIEMNVKMKAPNDLYNERWVIQSEPIEDFDKCLSYLHPPYISVKIFVSVIAPKRRLFYNRIEK